MTKAKLGDTVTIHYTGKLGDGSVFDSSVNRAPIEFKLGEKGVLPGLEDVVEGMSPGDKRTVEIPANQAYGAYDDELVREIERSSLPEDLDPKVGTRLCTSGPKNQELVLTVIEVGKATVKLDANHPLAGRDLTFEIELLGIA